MGPLPGGTSRFFWGKTFLVACEPFLAPFIAKEQIHITRPSHTSARGLGKISCTIGLGVIGLPQLFVIYKGLVHPKKNLDLGQLS